MTMSIAGISTICCNESLTTSQYVVLRQCLPILPYMQFCQVSWGWGTIISASTGSRHSRWGSGQGTLLAKPYETLRLPEVNLWYFCGGAFSSMNRRLRVFWWNWGVMMVLWCFWGKNMSLSDWTIYKSAVLWLMIPVQTVAPPQPKQTLEAMLTLAFRSPHRL